MCNFLSLLKAGHSPPVGLGTPSHGAHRGIQEGTSTNWEGWDSNSACEMGAAASTHGKQWGET